MTLKLTLVATSNSTLSETVLTFYSQARLLSATHIGVHRSRSRTAEAARPPLLNSSVIVILELGFDPDPACILQVKFPGAYSNNDPGGTFTSP